MLAFHISKTIITFKLPKLSVIFVVFVDFFILHFPGSSCMYTVWVCLHQHHVSDSGCFDTGQSFLAFKHCPKLVNHANLSSYIISFHYIQLRFSGRT